MPTKKPVLQVVIEQKYYDKISELAKADERSASYIAKKIIEQYFKELETKNPEKDI